MHEPAKRLVWDAHFTPFSVQNGKLWLGSKEVIPTDDATAQRDVIADAFDSPAGLGKGLNSMTLFIQGKVIGIRRSTIHAYMKRQAGYQMTASHPRVASRGLQVTSPFQTWCCDLIDCNFYVNVAANRGYRYIFSVLDLFSSYVWLVPLRKKEAANVQRAFESIVLQNTNKFDTAHVKSKLPGALWRDNGTEMSGEFALYLQQNHVTSIFNPPYVPVSNIEVANKQVRRLMRANFVKYASLDWVTHLQDIALSMNNNYNVKLRATPLQIMLDFFNRDMELINDAATRRRAEAEAKFKRHYGQDDRLNEGDHVRVRLASIYSNLRKRIKAGVGKLNVVSYSPTIYKIVRKIAANAEMLGYAS